MNLTKTNILNFLKWRYKDIHSESSIEKLVHNTDKIICIDNTISLIYSDGSRAHFSLSDYKNYLVFSRIDKLKCIVSDSK